jgi:hypothetical protein
MCRKNPPIGEISKDPYGQYFAQSYWPMVDKNDWCGSFLLKPEEKKES